MRRGVNKGTSPGGSDGLALAAGAKDLKQMPMNFEVILLGQRGGKLTDRTRIEWDGAAALRADKVMAMDWRARNVDWPPGGIENSRKDAKRCQNLKRTINGGSSRLADAGDRFSHQLLRGKGTFPAKRGSNDRPPGRGHAIAMPGHGGNRFRGGIDLGAFDR